MAHQYAAKLLTEVKEKLTSPQAWTQNAGARQGGPAGVPTSPYQPGADCWCLYIAMQLFNVGPRVVEEARNILEIFTQPDNLWTWNDARGRTHAEVIELLERGIAKALHA